MKHIFILVSIGTFLFPKGANAQKQYRVDDTQVLSTVQGYQYTGGHYEKELRFVEFLLDLELNPAEQKAGLAESLETFKADPATSLATIAQVDQQMQQVYALADVTQIALVRSALIAHLYQVYVQVTEKPLLIRWIDEHLGILALDPTNNLAFTVKDSDAFYDLMRFLQKLNGHAASNNHQEMLQLRNILGQQFGQMDLDTKRLLCTMALYTPYVKASYNALSTSEQVAFRQQIRGLNATHTANPPTLNGDQAISPETYGFLSEMSAQMHLSMLNAIENLGDEGGYWERRRY